MTSDMELKQTEERSNEVDRMWKDLETQMAEFDRDKEAFAREFGVEFEQYIDYFSKQAKDAAAIADEKTLADMEQQRQALQDEFEQEIAQAKTRNDAEKQLNKGSGAKRARRMRNMVGICRHWPIRRSIGHLIPNLMARC